MSTVLRVAAVQLELRAEADLERFATHVSTVVGQAADAGAELVVLPELASTGLLASDPDAASLRVADVPAAYRRIFPPCVEPIADLLREMATTRGISVLGGSHYRRAADGTYRNTALLAHADGRVERQDKLHLTPQEQAMGTTPGDEVLVTRVGPATVAVQICADVEFPEVSRHLALQGVDLILCPSLTWNRRGAQRIRYSTHARALENQLFVVTAPLVGSCGIPADGAIHGTGTALVASPIDRTFGLDDGVVAEHADTRAEGMVVADLELDLIAASRARPEPPGLSNVRPELYARLAARGCGAAGPDGPSALERRSGGGRREDGLHRALRHPAPDRVGGHGPGRAGTARRRGERSRRARLPRWRELPARRPARRDPGHPPGHRPPVRHQPPRAADAGRSGRSLVGRGGGALAGPAPAGPGQAARRRGHAHGRRGAGAGRGGARRATGRRRAHLRRPRVVHPSLPRPRHPRAGARRLRPAAEQAAAAGVDVVVAQGTEGGGHTGHVGTMALLPGVVDAVTVPVLAAGGIVDGRGLAAARCLGAAGAWMGTRFIASAEAYGHPAYKQRVVEATSRDTILSRAYTGKPLRTLENAWTREWAGRTAEIQPFPAQYAVAGVRVETGYQDGDVDEGMMPAGQGVQQLRGIQPAGDIVREVVAEAEAILRALSADA